MRTESGTNVSGYKRSNEKTRVTKRIGRSDTALSGLSFTHCRRETGFEIVSTRMREVMVEVEVEVGVWRSGRDGKD